MAVRDELENQNYQMKKMDGTTAEVDLTVSSWNRATIADGQWLQDKTIAPLSARDVYLADRIDEVSSSVATISEALADAGVTDGTGIAGFKVKSVNRLLDNDGGMSAFEGVPVSIVGTNDSNTITRDSLTFTTFSKDSENIDGIDEFDGIGGIIQGNTQDDAAVQIAMTPEGVYYRHVNGSTATTAFSDEDDATANYVTDPESFKKLQESLIAGTDLKIENGCVSVNTNGVIETSANVINAFVEGYGTYAGDNFAHAEGFQTSANCMASHTEGYQSSANGTIPGAHAEGFKTSALHLSHSEGYLTYAESLNSYGSHAEGQNTSALGGSHCEGQYTSADIISHAEGNVTRASGYSHTEGSGTSASQYSHAEGTDTSASGYSHSEGNRTSAMSRSHAEGNLTTADIASHAEGTQTSAHGNSHAEGLQTSADSTSHSEGTQTRALYQAHAEGISAYANLCSHAEGNNTSASSYAHSEGQNTSAYDFSHSEGSAASASGYSHAEGVETYSTEKSHAEGVNTSAMSRSHAEGYYASAYSCSHVEGERTSAIYTSHAEGDTTIAKSKSHAEGCMTSAFGSCSHVEGYYTIASGDYQHVFGRYNVKSKTGENFVEIVGNGTYKVPSNARTLDFSGNETLAGDLFFNGTSSLTDSLAAKQDLLEFSYDDNDTITAVNSSAIGGSSIEVFDGTNSGAVPSPETTTASGGKNYFLNAAAEWIDQPIISFTGTNNDETYMYSQSAYTFQEMTSDGGSVLVVRTNTAVNSEDENAEDSVLAALPTTSVTNTLSSRINSMEETFFPSANFQIDTAYQAVTSVYLDGTYYGLNGAGLTAVAVNSPLSGGGVAESPLGIMMSDDFMSDTNSLTLANIVVSFASSAADLIAPGSSSMKQWISAVVTAINTIARQLDSTN